MINKRKDKSHSKHFIMLLVVTLGWVQIIFHSGVVVSTGRRGVVVVNTSAQCSGNPWFDSQLYPRFVSLIFEVEIQPVYYAVNGTGAS